jgi:hypothetical protein
MSSTYWPRDFVNDRYALSFQPPCGGKSVAMAQVGSGFSTGSQRDVSNDVVIDTMIRTYSISVRSMEYVGASLAAECRYFLIPGFFGLVVLEHGKAVRRR